MIIGKSTRTKLQGSVWEMVNGSGSLSKAKCTGTSKSVDDEAWNLVLTKVNDPVNRSIYSSANMSVRRSGSIYFVFQ